jgi:ribose-phosphate pyrophosphokinase
MPGIVLPAQEAACIRALPRLVAQFERAVSGNVSRPRGRENGMAGNNGAIKLVAGNSNPALAEGVGAYIGIPLTKALVRRFADMEIFVEIQENVRGADVFVLQSTSFPANDHLMELLIIIDALRRASARRITAVIPYFGYARQDRKPGPRTPISAKLVANLITRAGADRVLTLDLHAGQIQGFFDIPTDNLFASPVMVRDIKQRFALDKVIVVSPDVGGVVRARGLAKRINAPLAIVDKRRERPGESEVANVIGEVDGHICILVDDIMDSGGTLLNAADALLEKGASAVYGYISHGVLSGGAVARVNKSNLKELVITDSIQPTEAVKTVPEHSRAPHCQSDRRSHQPHGVGRIGLEPVLRLGGLALRKPAAIRAERRVDPTRSRSNGPSGP